jgi:hypothetical protein
MTIFLYLFASKNQHALRLNLNFPGDGLAVKQISVTLIQLDFLLPHVIKHK